jgi:hypothetical protein
MKIKECHPDWYYPVQGMRTLILGTFPPHPDKRHYEFYYPNRQNRFWGVMAKIASTELLQTEGTEAVEERKRLMTQRTAALKSQNLKTFSGSSMKTTHFKQFSSLGIPARQVHTESLSNT